MTIPISLNPANREELDHLHTLKTAIRLAKRCIVITGAGISVTCGIPDFRSENGLYNLVKQKYPDCVIKGKDLFDANLFRNEKTRKVFFSFISELKAMVDDAKPTPTHTFIKQLDSSGKLLRCYTQNIDSLEGNLDLCCEWKDSWKETVLHTKVVQLHGTLNRVICTYCRKRQPYTEAHGKVFRDGEAPPCPTCEEHHEIRMALGKRALSVGGLRPDIVLYNEHHEDGEMISKLFEKDIKQKPDLLLVFGTSLKVVGIQHMVKKAAKAVHGIKRGRVIYVNLDPPPSRQSWNEVFDYHIIASSDETVEKILHPTLLLDKAIPLTDPKFGFKVVKRPTVPKSAKAKGVSKKVTKNKGSEKKVASEEWSESDVVEIAKETSELTIGSKSYLISAHVT